jgi:hypothetical protein
MGGILAPVSIILLNKKMIFSLPVGQVEKNRSEIKEHGTSQAASFCKGEGDP